MAYYNNLKLAKKFIITFLLVGLLPMMVIAYLALDAATKTIDTQVRNQLESVRDIKTAAVQRYFEQARAQVSSLAATPSTQEAIKLFTQEFNQVAAEDGWDQPTKEAHEANLKSYYDNEFKAHFSEKNDGANVDMDAIFAKLSPASKTLQSIYTSGNPNPLGSKHLLNQAEGKANYHSTHAKYHPGFAHFLKELGLYDIFLVDSKSGNVVYTVFKELDFSTNLLNGPYADTNLGRAFAKARNLAPATTTIEDFVMYQPSYNDAASFIATPIYEGNTQLGVLVFQLPLEPINNIMAQRTGMGETGESYLIGPDLLMRSDSYLDPKVHSVAASFRHPEAGAVNTKAAKTAKAGNKGVSLISDYNGNPALSAYAPIDLGDFTWSAIVEMDQAEAFAYINALKKQILYSVLIAAFLILILAWTNSTLLSKPIIALSTCLQRVRKHGDFSLRSNINRKDEIGMIGRAFDELMEDVSTTIASTNLVLKALSRADFSKQISKIHEGELGALAMGVNDAVEQIRVASTNAKNHSELAQDNMEKATQAAAEAAAIAQEVLVFKEALDSANTSTMIIDPDFKILYLNEAMQQLLKDRISDFQAAISGFSYNHLLGKEIATISKACTSLHTMIQTKSKSASELCSFGNSSFLINTTGILNKQGRYLGKVLEWQDRTAELNIENEIDQLVTLGSRGDFTKQIELTNKKGFALNISSGLNKMVSTTRNAMSEIKDVLSRLAEGDLTCRMSQEYEGDFADLKRDANLTIDRLNEVMENIASASSVIASSSQEIAAGISDLSNRTEEQAHSLQETSSTMNEMLTTIDNNVKSAKKGNDLANGSYTFARDGSESVQKSVSAMQDIEKSSSKISNIVSVIDGIAFQTNLLALNAAVEAARAGEQGRGFALVAGEVRQLAQRSASAAKEIKELIGTSVEQIHTGTALVSTSGETLSLMVAEIQEVSSMMNELMTSAQDQAAGIGKVNRTISHIDSMTQQNAALVEQASAAGETMANQAREMDQLVGFFKRAGQANSGKRMAYS